MRTPGFTTLLTLLSLAWPGSAQAAGAAAGTVISNQATVTATPSVPNAEPISSASNIVTTTVSAVCAPSVTPDGTLSVPGQRRNILPGEQATLPYRLLNVGNQTNSFTLGAALDKTSTFTPTSREVYLDDGSGQVPSGAQPLSTVTVGPDQGVNLLLLVNSSAQDRGSAFVSLAASCAPALGGASDTDNTAVVTVAEPPALTFTKTFSPAMVRPGDRSTVTLTVSNTGQGNSREIILTDPLNTPDLTGTTFVPGSASASTGSIEYSADGQSYTSSVTSPVAALRLKVPVLAPGAQATLTFALLTSAAAENHTLRNLATVTSSGVTDVQASAALSVKYSPAVALGPVGHPDAPEGSAEDRQTNDFAVVGQQVCFTQTLQNTGNVTDDFTVTGDLQTGAATLSLMGVSGALVQPIRLEPGQSVTFQACLTPTASGPLQLILTATGSRGERNSTTDLVSRTEARLPDLLKTVEPSGQVMSGQTLTYTLSVHNPYEVALTGVVLNDPLSEALTFITASDGGQVQAGTVVWSLASLAPGETRRLSVQAKVAAAAQDGDRIDNTFTLTSDQITVPISSNAVTSPVWSAALLVTKSVLPLEATVGDRLNYTVRIRNMSKGGTLDALTVTDTLPAGLLYLPGSSQLDGQGTEDPQVNGQVLTWTLGTAGPQSIGVLTYSARVTPEANGPLVNRVQVNGRGLNGTAIASNQATAATKLKPGIFAAVADLIGVVFVDRNRDGRYQPDLDTPIERARVVLADGRVVLTDASGRYHFGNVPEGFTALRLDPASVPYPALSVPEDGGQRGSRGLYARGLSSVDFPLAARYGAATIGRETTLRMGPLSLLKQIRTQEDGSFLATLTVESLQPLPGFTLHDPLPAGTRLKTGQSTVHLDLPAGRTIFSYTFEPESGASSTFCGTECVTTDPTVTWSTP